LAAPTLGPNQRRVVGRSSRAAVESSLTDVGRHIRGGDWLASSNRYRNDCARVLKDDETRGLAPRPGQLAQYASVSALLHAFDGWSYLGRSVQSHARGDFDTARHLAYYAELRAAMGILAAEGIAVLAKRHCAVEGRQDVAFWNGSSHEVTWAALVYVFEETRGIALLNDVVRPAGHSLGDWLQEFNPGASVAPIAKEWIESWGLDLSRLAQDRDARNIASYRPTPVRIGTGGTLDGPAVINSTVETWELLEPVPGDAFANIDLHLLRRSLESEFVGRTGAPLRQGQTRFGADVDRAVGALLADDPAANRIRDFLLRRVELADPALILRAESRADVRDSWHHVNVMSRAVLLLRLSTGVASWLLGRMNITSNDLDFWIAAIGNQRGLWTGDTPDSLTDLWGETKEAMDEALSLAASDPMPSMVDVGVSEAVARIGQFDRAGLWGLVS
jgi:hypothetical protein